MLRRLLGDYIGRLPVMSIGLCISAVSYLLIGPIPLLQVGPVTSSSLCIALRFGQASLQSDKPGEVSLRR